MTPFLRWVAAIPAGIASAVAMHLFVSVAFSIGHGFGTVASFWAAADMNGMWVSGTYILFVTRAATAAALVGVIVHVSPAMHKQVAIISTSIVCLASLVMLAFLSWVAGKSGASLVFGTWYRAILEFTSIVVGCVAGAGIALGGRERRARL